jgi:Ca2+-binding EF-hand superfamily protein
VFKIYDIDNTGFITLDNLAEFLGLIDEKEYLEMHE